MVDIIDYVYVVYNIYECAIWWRSCPEGLYGDLEHAEDIESVQRSPLCDIRVMVHHLLATVNIEDFSSPYLLIFKL